MEAQQPKLGEVLIAAGVISQLDLMEALAAQRADPTRPRLGQVFVTMNVATEGEICRALSGQLRLPFVDVRTLALDHVTVFLIPQAVAERHGVIAVSEGGGELVVAMSDPTNIVARDDIQASTSLRVKPVVAEPSLIHQAIARYYGRADTDQWSHRAARDPLHSAGTGAARAGVAQQVPLPPDPGFSVSRAAMTPGGTDSGPVDLSVTPPPSAAQVVDDAVAAGAPEIVPASTQTAADAANTVAVILNEAMKLGASEIRGEPGLEGLSVQFKVGGSYREMLRVPKHMQSTVTLRIKSLAGCDVNRHNEAQDGEIATALDRGRFKADVHFSPGLNGEKFIIKPREAANRLFEIEELGFEPSDLKLFNAGLELPRGLILVVGPTGSGVTSTLYAAVMRLKARHSNILTVERSVEHRLPGVDQQETDPSSGLGFEEALQTGMRTNPTAVMISDISDRGVAEKALVNAQSGHLVIAGMAAQDAPSAVTTLVELGISPSIVGEATALVVAQRLARTICPNCRTPADPPEKILSALGVDDEDTTWFRGDGCETCSYTGFLGTTGIFQLMPITDLMKEQLQVQVSETALMHSAASVGVRTLTEAAVERARTGLTSPEEIVRALDIVEENTFTCPGCAAEIKPDYLVCPFCSAYLGGSLCRGCGHELQPDWAACPYCGEVRTADDESVETGVKGVEGEQRILVVEDDDDVRRVIENTLSLAGFAVIGTSTGDDAVRLAVRHRPDLVLLDIGLPGEVDGIEACRQLRHTPQASLTPVIFLTARSDPDTEAAGFEAGGDDFLAKPIDEERLLARIRARLRAS